MAAANWQFRLGRTIDKAPIADLQNVTGRQIKLALNDRESAGFSINPLESVATMIKPVSTCLLAYRNGSEFWSGPIWTVKKDMPAQTMLVGCLGWYEFVNHYLLKTGVSAPSSMPSTTATSQQYVSWDQCSIAADLFSRGVADAVQTHVAPAFVNLGSIPSNTQPRTVTYQQYANIGQTIQQLANVEAGFDFRVDPRTRLLNMYYDPIWPVGGPYTVQGRGKVRQNALFAYKTGPANLQSLSESADASKLANDVYAVGQYATGNGYEPGSQSQYGLFSTQVSISDAVTTSILIAFAQAEATVLAQPMKIYTFDQMPLGMTSSGNFTALQPGVDFDIGDFAYLLSNYGIQVPAPGSSAGSPQPVRVFAYQIDIDEVGTEQCKNFQCVYTGAA